MKFRRFRTLVTAYGGDPSRWPMNERQDALRFLKASARARALIDEAEQLDKVLAGLVVAPAEPALRETILDVPNRARPVVSGAARTRHRRAWAPAATLAAAGVLGFAIGMTNILPTTNADNSADLSALVYGPDTIDEVMP